MSRPMAPELALEQLRELISILGELRNAGPRDQRFKQWRQITTTLLQRIWTGDPTRAEQFRRIPFSAPTAFADRQATRDYFERGCREAAAYLHGLALELRGGPTADAPATPPPAAGVDVGGAPAPAEVELGDRSGVPTGDPGPSPNEPIVDASSRADEPPARVPPPPPIVAREAPPAQAPPPSPSPVRDAPPIPRPSAAGDAAPGMGEAMSGPKPRLKDMLGFAEPASEPTRARPTPDAPPDQPPVSFLSRSPEPTAKVPPPASAPPSRPPASFVPLTPEPTVTPAPATAPPPWPGIAIGPPAAAAPPASTSAGGRAVAAEPPGRTPTTPARTGPTPEMGPTAAHASSGARPLLALAGHLEAFGVPMRERAIVRAALIDLARRIESPPIDWEALRETVALAMDHPALARRVLPLLLPHLDQAA